MTVKDANYSAQDRIESSVLLLVQQHNVTQSQHSVSDCILITNAVTARNLWIMKYYY